MLKAARGQHLLLDLHGAHALTDAEIIEQAMRDAAAVIGATVLEVSLHRFSGAGGITGVATLAESHISIHTWPEQRFAAVDVFVCGDLSPDSAVAVFCSAFKPASTEVTLIERGRAHRTDPD